MAPVTIPTGFAFVPRRTDANVAAQLLEAAEELGADLITSVRTTTGGYHATVEVADRYRENLEAAVEEVEEVEEESNSDGTESNPDGTAAAADGTADGEQTQELEPLPVTADSTHAEIDDYAASLDPKVEFPANTNKADKIALLEAARQSKSPDAE